MSDFDSDKSLSEIFRRAAKRIDRIAAFAFAALLTLVALIFYFHLENFLPFPVRPQRNPLGLLLLIPAVFTMYVYLGTLSQSNSKGEQLWNAFTIVGICIYTTYKILFQ